VTVEDLYETDKYTIHTVPVNNGELVVLLPRCTPSGRAKTVIILPELDCRNFILLAVLLVKNLFKVILACPRVIVDPCSIKTSRQIIISEHDGKIHVICGEENSVIEWNMSLDNILKILNKVVECREREDTSIHRAK